MVFKLFVLVLVAAFFYKWIVGRWPWQKAIPARTQALFEARKVLGLQADANRTDIIAAHKRVIALVHPDRGGSSAQVHEANAARDLLLDELPKEVSRDAPPETPKDDEEPS